MFAISLANSLLMPLEAPFIPANGARKQSSSRRLRMIGCQGFADAYALHPGSDHQADLEIIVETVAESVSG